MSSSSTQVFREAVFVRVGVCGCAIHNGKTPHQCSCIQGSCHHHTSGTVSHVLFLDEGVENDGETEDYRRRGRNQRS